MSSGKSSKVYRLWPRVNASHRRLEPLAQQSGAPPRILVEVAHAHVEHSAAEHVDVRRSRAVDRRRGSASSSRVVMRVDQRHWCASRNVTSTKRFVPMLLHILGPLSRSRAGRPRPARVSTNTCVTVPAHPGGDRIHQLHHFDDAHDRVGFTPADVDERRRAGFRRAKNVPTIGELMTSGTFGPCR